MPKMIKIEALHRGACFSNLLFEKTQMRSCRVLSSECKESQHASCRKVAKIGGGGLYREVYFPNLLSEKTQVRNCHVTSSSVCVCVCLDWF